MKRAKITNHEGMVGETLVSRCFRAIGDRPWRWFKIVWFVVFVLLLPLAFVNQSVTREPIQPPPESIPYRNYLKGGSSQWEEVSGIPTENIPMYDPTAWPNGRPRLSSHWNRRLGRERLEVNTNPINAQSGWPRRALWLVTEMNWDVTDHSKPFEPLYDRCETSIRWNDYSLMLNLAHTGGAGVAHLAVIIRSVLMFITAPIIAAFIIMCPMAMWYRARQGLRRRRNACMTCGQTRDPERRFAYCSECGKSHVEQFESPAIVRWRRRRQRVTIIVVFVLAAAWALTQFTRIRISTYSLRTGDIRAVSIGYPTQWLSFSMPDGVLSPPVSVYITYHQIILQLTLLFYIIVIVAAFARWRFSRRMRKV